MSNDLMVINSQLAVMPVMNLKEAAIRRQAMVDFVSGVMVKDKDYGVIPGTGDKPTLLKPGAEKLSTFFGLSPRFEVVSMIEDWTGKDHDGEPFFNYHYRCSLYRGDLLAGQGEGSCNSWEKKYRYRNVYPNQATEEEKQNGRLEQRTGKGGRPYSVYIVKNPNPADIVNTLQKMAQKRALVAATLIAVNASEFFTQDIEDMDFGHIIDGDYEEQPQKVHQPAQSAPKSSVEPTHGTWEHVEAGATSNGRSSDNTPEDERKVRASANNFMRTAIVEIPRYPTIDAVKGAMKKLGYNGVPGKPDERLAAYRNLKAYAQYRDAGMDSDAAIDAVMNKASE
jgi:hypothetical protein